MSTLPAIHLCIVQPLGYVHSLGLVDPARYIRHQFRRFGASVTMAKNRLRHDAVNLVFGAHLGFDAALRQRHACIFVNLEQLGAGGARVSSDYLHLLRTSAVIDYDADNLAAYAADPAEVPVVPMGFAPYLMPEQVLELEARPIDLLFVGSMNPRRQAWIERIEAHGVQVSLFDGALYGDERDGFIRQAKAVLNMHFYDSSRFEQARVSHCLSLGTPVIAERARATRPHPAFENAVSWLREDEIGAFFASTFKTPAFCARARAQIEAFAGFDPAEAYADALAFAAGFGRTHHERRSAEPWAPTRIHLGSGKDYKSGWLNLDVLDRALPDLVLDLSQPLALPLVADSATQGPLRLDAGQVEAIVANNVLEHVADLPRLMTNCLALLAPGGRLLIEVPYEHAATAWQDPTHLRALNENSWLYYTDWFWYLGWFEHRFAIEQSVYLDLELREAPRERAAFMRVVLQKVATTLRERMTARTFAPQLDVPDDAVDASWQIAQVGAAAPAALAA
ncbi:MAG: methyltransferase domain-containing protein [Burkholderiaceae bacterium]